MLNYAYCSDKYQYTMGKSFFDSGMKDKTAIFNLFYRKAPENNNWAVVSGVDEVLEMMMEADIDVRDVEEEDGSIIVYAEADQFHLVQEAFKQAGITEFTVAELTMMAQNDVELPEDAQAQFEKMIDAIEDLEDVQQVYHNVDLGE